MLAWQLNGKFCEKFYRCRSLSACFMKKKRFQMLVFSNNFLVYRTRHVLHIFDVVFFVIDKLSKTDLKRVDEVHL